MAAAERSSMYERHTFANPDTVQILGAKEDVVGIREADVLFSDTGGVRWYITLVTGEEYLVDRMNTWREAEQTGDLALNEGDRALEPPKFIWNGGMLNDADIRELICNAPLELLEPFLVQVTEETLAAGDAVHLS